MEAKEIIVTDYIPLPEKLKLDLIRKIKQIQ